MIDSSNAGSSFVDEALQYPVESSTIRFVSGHVIDVRTDVVRMPSGDTAERDVVVHPGAVGVIALDDDERVLFVQQYRHAVGHKCWEPPAGLLDESGEDPLEAARRELYEEAHVQAERWDVLVDAFTSPGMTDEAVRIYLARNVRAAEGERHRGEHEELDMPTRWVSLDLAVDAVLAGHLHNPMAAMGVLATAAARGDGYSALRSADAPWAQMSQWPGSRAAHS
ncbi:MAG TPA: NUDIX hydrolase [Mycobacteriales bacterium]|nr:NUDIX hydrolase [Mycobacteriales bacterium]